MPPIYPCPKATRHLIALELAGAFKDLHFMSGNASVTFSNSPHSGGHGPPLVLCGWCATEHDLIEEDIQLYLDKRKPGRSRFTTQRREADEVEILGCV